MRSKNPKKQGRITKDWQMVLFRHGHKHVVVQAHKICQSDASLPANLQAKSN
jgi:soluble cytochrome b562